MIDAVLHWSLAHRAVVLFAALVLLVWGAWVTVRMPVDVFPDLTAPTVTVLTEAHGMAPEELEARVTFPIETSLNGAPGVRRVRSISAVGISIVHVDFEWGADVFRARQIVNEKLQLARATLPAELEPPLLAPVSSIMGEVLFVAMQSNTHDAMTVRTAADFQARRHLLAIPGVSQVTVLGGERKQLEVVLAPDKLAAYQTTASDVLTALRETSESVSGGFVVEGGQEYLVHGAGRIRDAAELQDTLVAMRGKEPVLVRHLADVRLGAAQKRGEGSYRGTPSVILGIQKQPGVGTIELTARLDRALDELQRTLPEGMTLRRDLFRQATFIETAIENVQAALRDGVLLVLIVVLVFLASGRASLITLLAIPLSLLTAIFALSMFGASLNTLDIARSSQSFYKFAGFTRCVRVAQL